MTAVATGLSIPKLDGRTQLMPMTALTSYDAASYVSRSARSNGPSSGMNIGEDEYEEKRRTGCAMDV